MSSLFAKVQHKLRWIKVNKKEQYNVILTAAIKFEYVLFPDTNGSPFEFLQSSVLTGAQLD